MDRRIFLRGFLAAPVAAVMSKQELVSGLLQEPKEEYEIVDVGPETKRQLRHLGGCIWRRLGPMTRRHGEITVRFRHQRPTGEFFRRTGKQGVHIIAEILKKGA